MNRRKYWQKHPVASKTIDIGLWVFVAISLSFILSNLYDTEIKLAKISVLAEYFEVELDEYDWFFVNYEDFKKDFLDSHEFKQMIKEYRSVMEYERA